MKIVEVQSGVLTNEQVLHHVKAVRHNQLKNNRYEFATKAKGTHTDGTPYTQLKCKLKDLNYVTADVIKHFSADSALADQAGGPPGEQQKAEACLEKAMAQYAQDPKSDAAHDTSVQQNQELVRRLKGYKLTKSEVLMISNHRPRNEQVLEVCVEEFPQRFNEQSQAEIVEIIREVYGLEEAMEE